MVCIPLFCVRLQRLVSFFPQVHNSRASTEVCFVLWLVHTVAFWHYYYNYATFGKGKELYLHYSAVDTFGHHHTFHHPLSRHLH